MLVARRLDAWPRQYRLVFDDVVTATLTPYPPLLKGTDLDLAGDRYGVDVHGPRAALRLARPPYTHGDDRPVLAEAVRTGRATWTVTGGDGLYEMRHARLRRRMHLRVGATHAGTIRRRGRDATADLPGLPPSLQAFILIVALTEWDPLVTDAYRTYAPSIAHHD